MYVSPVARHEDRVRRGMCSVSYACIRGLGLGFDRYVLSCALPLQPTRMLWCMGTTEGLGNDRLVRWNRSLNWCSMQFWEGS